MSPATLLRETPAMPLLDAMDRINHVSICLEAVSDLVVPQTDLHLVDRDKFAILMAFLLTEQRLAYDQLGAQINLTAGKPRQS